MNIVYAGTLVLCLTINGTLRSIDDTLATYVKVGLNASITVGFGYALFQLYQDMTTDQKRYYQTAHYFEDNKNRLVSDTFTGVGLAYLTYQSAFHTIETMKNLIDREDDEEKQQY
jgi:hypothetical protein